MLQQFMTLSLLASVAAISPAASQGIRPGSCADCSKAVVSATKVVVSTPCPANSADSANAVNLGNALRDKLSRELGGDWQVISRAEMNRNLANSGYAPDALLPYDQARQLATFLSSRVFVTTALGKGSDGRYVASSLVRGISDDAGQLVKLTQAPGQQMPDFGNKLADQVAVVFKAYADARVCNDQQTTNKAKAIEAANKALKTVPNFGYAEYCIAEIAQQTDSASNDALLHFKNAVIGDPLSLKAVNQLAMIHQRRHDSTAVVADFQQMITIAPTNRPLAEAAVKVFRQYNRPDAAEQVVNQQMQLDPTSPDWPDLKGNSCLAAGANEQDSTKVKPKFQCAYAAFGQEYTLDPTRVDSLFFQKIIYVAQNQADSLTWARRFVDKFPNSTTPLEIEASIYASSGQTDSATSVVARLTKIDPSDYRPVIAVTMALLSAKKDSAALQLASYIKASNDSAAKNTYAGVLIQAADSASRRAADSTTHTVADDSLMVHLGQAVVALDPPDHSRIEFAHYFIVRGLQNGLTTLSKTARTDKSCDTVKRYQALLNLLEPSLNIIAVSANAGIAGYGKQLLAPVQAEQKAVPQIQAAYCK